MKAPTPLAATAKVPVVQFVDVPHAGTDSRRASLLAARRASMDAPTNTKSATGTKAATAAQPGTATLQASDDGVLTLQLPPKDYSKAAEFDKGARRSTSDYHTLSDKEGWAKWQRQLIGTAFEHKCEQVLDATHNPDPHDPDDVALFESKQ